jgi:hypothetical protein
MPKVFIDRIDYTRTNGGEVVKSFSGRIAPGEVGDIFNLRYAILLPDQEHVSIISDNNTDCCAYCGSTSPDDRRGNCAACGGPRI